MFNPKIGNATRRSGLYFMVGWLLLATSACDEPDPNIRFDVAQPASGQSVASFERPLIGQWLSLDDSSLLVVSPTAIVRKSVGKVKLTLKSDGRNDSLKVSFDNGKVKINGEVVDGEFNQKDSTITVSFSDDTLFAIGPDHILKRDKMAWFLNTHKPNGYLVRRLRLLDQQTLSYDRLDEEVDTPKLANLAASSIELEDSTEVTVSKPTSKQFRRFLRQDGFANRERFKKVR